MHKWRMKRRSSPKTPTRVYLVGGGASLIYSALQTAYATLGDRVTLISNAQTHCRVKSVSITLKTKCRA